MAVVNSEGNTTFKSDEFSFSRVRSVRACRLMARLVSSLAEIRSQSSQSANIKDPARIQVYDDSWIKSWSRLGVEDVAFDCETFSGSFENPLGPRKFGISATVNVGDWRLLTDNREVEAFITATKDEADRYCKIERSQKNAKMIAVDRFEISIRQPGNRPVVSVLIQEGKWSGKNEAPDWLEEEKRLAEKKRLEEKRLAEKKRLEEERLARKREEAARIVKESLAKYEEFIGRFDVEAAPSLSQLSANPYAYQRQTILVKSSFERMIGPNEAVFGGGISEMPLVVTEVPSTRFVTPGVTVLLAAKVIGHEEFAMLGVKIPVLRIEYVGAHDCMDRKCSDMLAWQK